MNKVKTWIKEHKNQIYIAGGFVAGSILTYAILKRKVKPLQYVTVCMQENLATMKEAKRVFENAQEMLL